MSKTRQHWSRALRRRRQAGVAALGVALMIVVVTTVVTVGVAQVGANDQKGMANEYRSRQAGSMAELGLDRGITYLNGNKKVAASTAAGGWMNAGGVKWAACAGTETTPPCGDGKANLFGTTYVAYSDVDDDGGLTITGETLPGSYKVHYVTQRANAGSVTPGNGVYYVVSEGTSEDGQGEAIIRKGIVFAPAIGAGPDAPLIAAGTMDISGTLSVVANPNGGGQGVPLSAWAGDDIDVAGANMKTCYYSEYFSTDSTYSYQTDADGKTITICQACNCPNVEDQQISRDDHEDIDILDVDGGPSLPDNVNPDSTYFPPDLFEYMFGVPESEYLTIKHNAQIITDCSSLGPSSSGLIWITGNCTRNNGGSTSPDIGTFADPVILVIEDGDFKMNAKFNFFGVVFVFMRTGTYDVSIQGTPTLIGALLSTEHLDIGNGNFTARYDADVIGKLANPGGPASLIAEAPGTWTNYQVQ